MSVFVVLSSNHCVKRHKYPVVMVLNKVLKHLSGIFATVAMSITLEVFMIFCKFYCNLNCAVCID